MCSIRLQRQSYTWRTAAADICSRSSGMGSMSHRDRQAAHHLRQRRRILSPQPRRPGQNATPGQTPLTSQRAVATAKTATNQVASSSPRSTSSASSSSCQAAAFLPAAALSHVGKTISSAFCRWKQVSHDYVPPPVTPPATPNGRRPRPRPRQGQLCQGRDREPGKKLHATDVTVTVKDRSPKQSLPWSARRSR